MSTAIDWQAEIDRHYGDGSHGDPRSPLRALLLRHSRSVADLALELAHRNRLHLDDGDIEAAAMLHDIGIIATEATVESRAFETALHRLGRVTTCSLACPLFVSLAENGFTSPEDPVAREAVRHYLPPLRKTGIDTLILGCTHFPLLAPQISAALPGVRLIGAGEAAAAAMVAANPKVGHGELEVYVSDAPARFEKEAERLLGATLPTKVQKYAL